MQLWKDLRIARLYNRLIPTGKNTKKENEQKMV